MKLIALLIASIATLNAAEVRYEWVKIEEPNLAFYRFQWGPSPGVRTNSVTVTNATTCTIALLAGSTNYASLTAVYWVGESGEESEPTPELVYVVPLPRPSGLRVTTTLQVAGSPAGPWTDLWTMTQLANLDGAPLAHGSFYRSQTSVSEDRVQTTSARP